MQISTGSPTRLGATIHSNGINFAVYSEHATRVDVVLFSDTDPPEFTASFVLPGRTTGIWHGLVEGLSPPCRYGFSVTGPDSEVDRNLGHRFDANLILLDPYAREVSRHPERPGSALENALPNPDRTETLVLGRVRDHSFDWSGDIRPATPWEATIIYETHVRGISLRHPDVAAELRGTYAGLASDPILEHLTGLGITAVELLPVHAKFSELRLVQAGLSNYWGYCPLAYFSPEPMYAYSDNPVLEFKSLVRKLHQAGLEVILDVVFNHTAEGDEQGPTLSFRGIDNRTYYKMTEETPREYLDYTGTGNTLAASHPAVQRLILECLRYWVEEMHVDGFRFDLATSLARKPVDIDMPSSVIDRIQADPVLADTKLIVEPWDLGPEGYQVGAFPASFKEWNGAFRDRTRRRWCGYEEAETSAVDGLRSPGGADAANTICFVTAHDGFTLEDLVSYEQKHNLANLEQNRDGHQPNFSNNHGIEGPLFTDGLSDERSNEIRNAREATKQNLFSALVDAPGVPMMLGGDELSRTQRGNNNAYCQDNPISWYDWNLDERKEAFLKFCRAAIASRAARFAERLSERPDTGPNDDHADS